MEIMGLKFNTDMSYMLSMLQENAIITIVCLCVFVFLLVKLPTYGKLIPLAVAPIALSLVSGSFYSPSQDLLVEQLVKNAEPKTSSSYIFDLASNSDGANFKTLKDNTFEISTVTIKMTGNLEDKKEPLKITQKGTTVELEQNEYTDQYINAVKNGTYRHGNKVESDDSGTVLPK